nr:MAG TPA: hypothetical protein [Caudoviricetes sp.]
MDKLLNQLIDILNVEETTDSEKIDQIYDLLQEYADKGEKEVEQPEEKQDMTDEEVLKAVEG